MGPPRPELDVFVLNGSSRPAKVINSLPRICNDGNNLFNGASYFRDFRFDQYTLDSDRYRLEADGKEIALEPLVFEHEPGFQRFLEVVREFVKSD